MAQRKLPEYLRTYRRRAGLTQAQMAYLLGCKSGSKVSRYERRARLPSLEAALAYEIVLHQPLKKLFAGIYDKIRRRTERRARRLAKWLLNEPSKKV